MVIPLNDELIKYLVKNVGNDALYRAICADIDLQRGNESREIYLERKGRRPDALRRSLERMKKGEASNDDIRKLLLLADPFIRLETRPMPWRDMPRGRVLVFLGVRSVPVPGVRSIPQPFVGYRDMEACLELQEILAKDLRVDRPVELRVVGPEITDVVGTMEGHLKQKDTAMIVVLGSSVVNPASNWIAEKIWQGPLPFSFRFAFPEPHAWSTSSAKSDGSGWAKEDEGIYVPSLHETVRRTHDDLIPNTGADGNRQTRASAKDAGVLMVRYDPFQPFLMLAAGHGGAGTLAAIQILKRRTLIDDLARNAEIGSNPPSRFCAVLDVSRRIPDAQQGEAERDLGNLDIRAVKVAWPASAGLGS